MFNVSPIAETINAPSRQPPRDVTIEPSAFLPPVVNIVECLRLDPVTVQPVAPLSRKAAAIAASEAAARGDLTTAVALPTAEQRAAERAAALAPPRISETCKFSSAEREKLLNFRTLLANCVVEMDDLRQMILEDDGSSCGLPRLCEKHRVRLAGSTFSLEDARRELCSAWLLDKLKQYKDYVDSALADELEAGAPPRSRNTSARSSPAPTPTISPTPCDGDRVNAISRPPTSNGYARAPVEDSDQQPRSLEQGFTLSRVPVIKPLGI
eukprot:TRINITY_DN3091_c0_g1_i1.p1 TRINITY_DN3091_c0_g1~~TRINITY_DN3091_c0_g1_i1.p1  ORF type:complete len:268 (-),score=42.95 TRINITY_DN3091_c0_g1_i1:380-1183(-)